MHASASTSIDPDQRRQFIIGLQPCWPTAGSLSLADLPMPGSSGHSCKKRAAPEAPPRVWGGVQEREGGGLTRRSHETTMHASASADIDLDQRSAAFFGRAR